MTDLVAEALAGRRRALARLLSLVEGDGAEAREALARLCSRTGRAHVIGVTGAPGSGKSTLVAQLAAAYRRRNAPWRFSSRWTLQPPLRRGALLRRPHPHARVAPIRGCTLR